MIWLRDVTVVIYHSAILACVRQADRPQFAQTVRELGKAWLSNEVPGSHDRWIE